MNLINKTFSNSIIILFFANSGNLVNMITQIILSRELSYYDFSLYYSLLAIIGYFIIPGSTLSMFFQKDFFTIKNDNQKIISYLMITSKKYVIFILILFLFFFTQLDFLKNKLSHYDNYIFFNFFIVLIFTLYRNWPMSLNLALGYYQSNSIIYFITDFIKLLIILVMFYFFNEKNLFTLLNINLLFVITLCLFTFYPLRKIFISTKFYYKNKKINFNKKNFFYYFLYSFLIPFFLSTDIIIAKIVFGSELSSKYIVASTLSKIIYFFPSSLFTMLFNESLKVFKKNIIIIFIICSIIISIASALLIVFGDVIISNIYGNKYLESSELLIYLVPSIILLSFSKICCDILISKNNFAFLFFQYFAFCLFLLLCKQDLETLNALAKNVLYTSVFFSFFVFTIFLKNFYLSMLSFKN